MSNGELAYTLAFYFFGAVAIATAVFAVISKRILRAAVGLAATLVCGAIFYVLLSYDFIAVIQVLVYVGGIVVLIVYAIMLTSTSELVESHPSVWRKVTAFAASVLFLVFSLTALIETNFSVNLLTSPPSDIAIGLGRLIFSTDSSGYVVAFEVISLLLLAAVIGAIVIARSHYSQTAGAEKGNSAR